ncbi:MAG: CaiB/BaiF CoA-transferase family protein [Candidatus Obscuribacter sp.]|nr:CaiB/BaiF CoA-transferase family protein [Candidatus Obscuribacter sp.]
MSLRGIKVLDFTHLLPGETASTLLSDMGAQVLRIERLQKGLNESLPPLVKGESLYYWSLHRNKTRLRLDLKKPGAIEIVKTLAKDADVLIENFRPDAMERLGLSFEALSQVNPGLVYCSISGYGSNSKWRHRPGHDLTFVAEAGILDETRDGNGTPVMPGVFVSDYMSGVYGALAVVAALLERKESGRGKHVEISMFESALSTLGVLSTAMLHESQQSVPLTNRYPEALPNHRLYRCKDDRYLACAPVEPQFWKLFLEKIGRLDLLAKHPLNDKDYLMAEIAAAIEKRTLAEWMTVFHELDCCVSPVNTIEEALDFLPEGRARVLTEIEHPLIGKVSQVTNPIYQLFKSKNQADWFAADSRANMETLLKERGYDTEKIEALRAQNVIE